MSLNKVAFYILLVLIYLGLSKSFSPNQLGIIFVPDEKVFGNYFKEAPVSLVLLDQTSTGFLIKSYYQKYQAIYLFKPSEIVFAKVSEEFYLKNKVNIGMSLFRRFERNNAAEALPLPPGSLYVGDKSYGYWSRTKSGKRVWKFHRAYKNLYRIFKWGKFRPSKEFSKKIEQHREIEKPFYGLREEFGTNGYVTIKAYSNRSKDENTTVKPLIRYFKTITKFETKVRKKAGVKKNLSWNQTI